MKGKTRKGNIGKGMAMNARKEEGIKGWVREDYERKGKASRVKASKRKG